MYSDTPIWEERLVLYVSTIYQMYVKMGADIITIATYKKINL